MAQELVKRICRHCNEVYAAIKGSSSTHCVQCFSCEQFKPFITMYGRVGGMGYCCRECEEREQVSSHLIFETVLNLPGAVYARV